MSETLTVVRDGVLRVYRVEGVELNEIAFVALQGGTPDDADLAIVSTALVQLSQGGSKAPRKALPEGKPRRAPMKTEALYLETVARFDDQWRPSRSVGYEGSQSYFGSVCRKVCELGWLERRIETAEEQSQRISDGTLKGRQAWLYRRTPEGTAALTAGANVNALQVAQRGSAENALTDASARRKRL